MTSLSEVIGFLNKPGPLVRALNVQPGTGNPADGGAAGKKRAAIEVPLPQGPNGQLSKRQKRFMNKLKNGELAVKQVGKAEKLGRRQEKEARHAAKKERKKAEKRKAREAAGGAPSAKRQKLGSHERREKKNVDLSKVPPEELKKRNFTSEKAQFGNRRRKVIREIETRGEKVTDWTLDREPIFNVVEELAPEGCNVGLFFIGVTEACLNLVEFLDEVEGNFEILDEQNFEWMESNEIQYRADEGFGGKMQLQCLDVLAHSPPGEGEWNWQRLHQGLQLTGRLPVDGTDGTLPCCEYDGTLIKIDRKTENRIKRANRRLRNGHLDSVSHDELRNAIVDSFNGANVTGVRDVPMVGSSFLKESEQALLEGFTGASSSSAAAAASSSAREPEARWPPEPKPFDPLKEALDEEDSDASSSASEESDVLKKQ